MVGRFTFPLPLSSDRFACSRKKGDPLPLYAVRRHPQPFILQPFSFLAPYFLIICIYIYIFSAPIQCFFSFFLFPHLSPPLPFFSVFLMLVHRSNHLFTYSFIYPPDLRIFIRSRTLGNSLGNSVTITVSDLLLFPQFVAWILLVEYSRFTRVNLFTRDF